ncbi:pilus assembly protein [Leucobacter sp. 1207-22]
MLAKFLREERGSVTAEFALTLPMVLLVFGIVVGGVSMVAYRTGLTGLAGAVARLEARGDAELAAQLIAQFPARPDISRERRGELLCISAAASPGTGLLSMLRLSARGCAAVSEGRP